MYHMYIYVFMILCIIQIFFIILIRHDRLYHVWV